MLLLVEAIHLTSIELHHLQLTFNVASKILKYVEIFILAISIPSKLFSMRDMCGVMGRIKFFSDEFFCFFF